MYVAGCGARLYRIDPSDGSVEWSSQFSARPYTSALVAADGAILSNTGGGRNSKNPTRLEAFDTTDGRRLWSLDDVSGGGATPSVWKHEGKEYIIVGNPTGEVRALNPRDGEELWKLTGVGCNNFTIRVSPDYMIAETGPANGDSLTEQRIAGYRISPSGATRLWTLDPQYGSMQNGVIYNDTFYGTLRWGESPTEGALAVDMATGDIVGQIDLIKVEGEGGDHKGNLFASRASKGGYAIAVNGFFISEQNEGHTPMQIVTYATSPFALADSSVWVPPHPQTCTYSENKVGMGYAYVEGRMFIRGLDGIYCYDLRKLPSGTSTTDMPDRVRRVFPASHARPIEAYDLRGRRILQQPDLSRRNSVYPGVILYKMPSGKTSVVIPGFQKQR